LVPAEINGMQSQGVMSTTKHYVCNDQEFNREFQDVEVDERTLREIYLPPFEGAVKLSRSAAFMGRLRSSTAIMRAKAASWITTC
jgi:beta-glucosidase